jgi:hypothetical protein
MRTSAIIERAFLGVWAKAVAVRNSPALMYPKPEEKANVLKAVPRPLPHGSRFPSAMRHSSCRVAEPGP